MQHNQHRQLVPNPQAGVPVPETPTIHAGSASATDTRGADALQRTWALIVRRKWIIFVAGVAGAAAGILFSLLQTPAYRSRVSMEVQNFRDDFMDMGKVDPTSINYDADSYVQTQVKFLESDALLARVAKKVPFKETSAPHATEGLGQRVAVFLHLNDGQPEKPRQEAIRKAAGSLAVRGSGMTRLIEVYAEAPSPQFAADYLNTLASEFIQQSLEDRWDSAERVANWLTGQLDTVKSKLADVRAAPQCFFPPERSSVHFRPAQ